MFINLFIGIGLINQLLFQQTNRPLLIPQKERIDNPDPTRPLSQPILIPPNPVQQKNQKPEIFEIGIAKDDKERDKGEFYSQLARLAKEGKIIFPSENFRSIGYWQGKDLIPKYGCERVNKEMVRCKWSSDGQDYWLNMNIKDLPMIVLVNDKGEQFITKDKLQDFINQQDMKITFSPYDPLNKLTPPSNILQIMSKAIIRSGVKIFYRDRPSYNADEGLTNIPARITLNDKIIMLGLKPNGGVLFSDDPTLYPSFRDVTGAGGFLGPAMQGIIQSLPLSVTAFVPGISIPPSINSGSITVGAGLSFALPWTSVPAAGMLINNQTKPTILIAVLTLDKQKQPEGYYIVGGKFKITFDPSAAKSQDAVQFYVDDKRVSEAEFKKVVQVYQK